MLFILKVKSKLIRDHISKRATKEKKTPVDSEKIVDYFLSSTKLGKERTRHETMVTATSMLDSIWLVLFDL